MTAPVDPGGRAVLSWCLYDWANSAYPTVIGTFVFAAYFTKAVAADEVSGTATWAFAMSLSAIAAAIASPILGAIADRGGRRKPWLLVFTLLCSGASMMLWYAEPDPAFVTWAVVFVIIAGFAFETGQVFYNAMLPDLAPPNRIGRLSGWGWGLGYAGGLCCLGIALVGFVQTESPWFGLSTERAENIRGVTVLVGVWFALFALPLFLFAPDTPRSDLAAGEAIRRGIATIVRTLRDVRHYRPIVVYLIAHMLYADGLSTLFAFGGIYAAGTFDMSFTEIIVFGIAMNVTAGLGAFAFAWVDDWIGPKKTILIALAFLAVLGALLLVVEGKTLFWVFALPLGIFVGPAQAASRSMMARLIPPGMANEMFGLYALSGKATTFLGPLLLGLLTTAFDSQRAGMSVIVVLIVAGGGVLAWLVIEPRR